MLKIPENLFVRSSPNEAKSQMARNGNAEASSLLIRETVAQCGLSFVQLGKLMGLPIPLDVFKWSSGRSRPSPIYSQRLNYLALLELAHPGQLCHAQAIDWKTGMITWKREKHGPEIPAGFVQEETGWLTTR